MKVSLLFPPSWHPSQPYLSLPCLTAFLDQAGITEKSQRDLNIEMLDTILTRTYGLLVYERLVDKLKQLEKTREGEFGPGSDEHYAKVVEALDRFPHLIDEIEPAKASLRCEEFYDINRYRECLFLIDRWLEVVSSIGRPVCRVPGGTGYV